MEISPIILAKMLLVAFLFGIQSGVAFDVGRALRALFLGEVRGRKLKKIYGAKIRFSGRIIGENSKKSTRIFKNITIFLCDFLWAIGSFFGLVMINYAYNDGGIRIFTVLGAVVGFLTYYFTLSKLVIFMLGLACFLIRFSFFVIFDTIRMPFLKIYNILVKNLKKTYKNIRFRIEKKRKMVYNVCEVVYKNEDVKNDTSRVKISVKAQGEKSEERMRENEKE